VGQKLYTGTVRLRYIHKRREQFASFLIPVEEEGVNNPSLYQVKVGTIPDGRCIGGLIITPATPRKPSTAGTPAAAESPTIA
jgi:hypothetical protein